MSLLARFKPFKKGVVTKAVSPVRDQRSIWTTVFESFTGAWQRNITVNRDQALAHHAQFACITLIANDVGKMRVKLIGDDNGVWVETKNPAYDPVLRKPNPYQTRNQFWASYIICKLIHGNVYVLKVRDGSGVVRQLHILDPQLVTVLVSDDGAVFYQVNPDNLSGVKTAVVVPAREIIHDRFNCLFHPLVGVPPLFASGLASMQGLAIQEFGTHFFRNDARPSGILTVPGAIGEAAAKEAIEKWRETYGGKNAGKVALLQNGVSFKEVTMNSVDAELINQLKMTAEIVCSTYHVPPYKIGAAQVPTANNVQALNLEYYSQCLQSLIEEAETCLDEGLGLPTNIGVEFDVDALLRMDTETQINALDKAVKSALMMPNEGRKRLGLPWAEGGDALFLQQQNYSLPALAKRDASEDPFAKSDAPKPSAAEDEESETRSAFDTYQKAAA